MISGAVVCPRIPIRLRSEAVFVEFEWDEEKHARNVRKHQVSFPVAVRIFDDERCTTRMDDRYDEQRWVSIGLVHEVELVVAYTFHGEKIP